MTVVIDELLQLLQLRREEDKGRTNKMDLIREFWRIEPINHVATK
jgi:hypothetical protein